MTWYDIFRRSCCSAEKGCYPGNSPTVTQSTKTLASPSSRQKTMHDLPPETVGKIMSLVSVRDLQNMLGVNRRMRDITVDCVVGTEALMREFERFERRNRTDSRGDESLCMCCERRKEKTMLKIVRIAVGVWGADVIIKAVSKHLEKRGRIQDVIDTSAEEVSQLLILVFQSACTLSNTGLTHLLLDFFQSRASMDLALNRGCVMNCSKMVQVLLSRVKLTSNELSDLLNQACWSGSTSVVKMLLTESAVKPTLDNTSALSHICADYHPDIVKLVLQHTRIDPDRFHFGAFLQACKCNYAKVIERMLEDGQIDEGCIRYETSPTVDTLES